MAAILSRKDILRGLRRLDEKARKAHLVVEIAIYGGAALCLAFDTRAATRDVDVVIRSAPQFVRKAASEIAREEEWPEEWLNDGVKGFIAASEDLRLMQDFTASGGTGLRIFVPSPEYLFAMKCMSMRAEGLDGSHDISDIEALADIAGIADAREALTIVESFYPSARVPPKVRFGVEEIMERVNSRRVAAKGR
jgi:Nucleotidyltransferase of unknown function (DUF6036)